MYHMITNARHKVAHVAGPNAKPLCTPNTKASFHITLITRNMRVCAVCCERELHTKYHNGER